MICLSWGLHMVCEPFLQQVTNMDDWTNASYGHAPKVQEVSKDSSGPVQVTAVLLLSGQLHPGC